MESLNRINKLKRQLESKVDKLAIFGSYLTNEDYNDIDLLLFVEPNEIQNIKNIIIGTKDIGKLYIEKYICNYNRFEEIEIKDEESSDEKPIHISFLPNNYEDYKNTLLWKKNSNNIKFLC